jgi:hypothetical protein
VVTFGSEERTISGWVVSHVWAPVAARISGREGALAVERAVSERGSETWSS